MLYPHSSFGPSLLLDIIKDEFPTVTIEVNSRKSNNWSLMVQLDCAMSWGHAPEYRTKNCQRVLMVLLAMLAKQNKLDNRIIQTFKQFLN